MVIRWLILVHRCPILGPLSKSTASVIGSKTRISAFISDYCTAICKYLIGRKDSGGNVTSRRAGGTEAIFLSGRLIDRQDFIRNLLNHSYFFSIFAFDFSHFPLNNYFL